MVGTMPVILAVGAALFAHERMDTVGWTALAGSTTGAALIALGGRHAGTHATGGPSLAGDLLVVLSLIIALFWILLNKHLMQRHSALVITAYGLFLGTLMLVPIVPSATAGRRSRTSPPPPGGRSSAAASSAPPRPPCSGTGA